MCVLFVVCVVLLVVWRLVFVDIRCWLLLLCVLFVFAVCFRSLFVVGCSLWCVCCLFVAYCWLSVSVARGVLCVVCWVLCDVSCFWLACVLLVVVVVCVVCCVLCCVCGC